MENGNGNENLSQWNPVAEVLGVPPSSDAHAPVTNETAMEIAAELGHIRAALNGLQAIVGRAVAKMGDARPAAKAQDTNGVRKHRRFEARVDSVRAKILAVIPKDGTVLSTYQVAKLLEGTDVNVDSALTELGKMVASKELVRPVMGHYARRK